MCCLRMTALRPVIVVRSSVQKPATSARRDSARIDRPATVGIVLGRRTKTVGLRPTVLVRCLMAGMAGRRSGRNGCFGAAAPFLQAISMLTNDFVTMSRAADRARPSLYPNAWRIHNLTLAAVPLGVFRLVYLLAILSLGWFVMDLTPSQLQTLTFAMLVFANQGNVYVLRERGRLWHSCLAPIMLVASACDIILVACLAAGGVLMSPLPLTLISLLIIATVVFTLAMDTIKLAVFARIRID